MTRFKKTIIKKKILIEQLFFWMGTIEIFILIFNFYLNFLFVLFINILLLISVFLNLITFSLVELRSKLIWKCHLNLLFTRDFTAQLMKLNHF